MGNELARYNITKGARDGERYYTVTYMQRINGRWTVTNVEAAPDEATARRKVAVFNGLGSR